MTAAAPGTPHGNAMPATPYVVAPRSAPPTQSDANRNRIALVLSIATAAVALWATLGYVNDVTRTLSSIGVEIERLEAGLELANDGMRQLEPKVAEVQTLAQDTAKLEQGMTQMNSDMKAMNGNVASVGADLGSMSASLSELEDDLTSMDEAKIKLVADMKRINKALVSQGSQVRGMRRGIVSTHTSIEEMPIHLKAASQRITFINRVVCIMGREGVAADINVKVEFTVVPVGTGLVRATLIPPGAWTC